MQQSQLPSRRRFTFASAAVLCVVALWAPHLAGAAPSESKPPSIEIKKGKAKIGSETLRSRVGEANGYHSTTASIRDGGRAFTQRAHLVLDDKGALVTYDRWIDVKGATIRVRAFEFEGNWKLVLFGQPGEKNKVTDFAIKARPVIFDERSPAINALAATLAGNRATVPFIRVDETSAGEASVAREALVDAAGHRFVRTTFKAPKFTVVVLLDSDGRVVATRGPGLFSGHGRAIDEAKLKPAVGESAAVKPPPAEPSPDAPPPPPSDDPEGRPALPPPSADKLAPPAAPPPPGKPPLPTEPLPPPSTP